MIAIWKEREYDEAVGQYFADYENPRNIGRFPFHLLLLFSGNPFLMISILCIVECISIIFHYLYALFIFIPLLLKYCTVKKIYLLSYDQRKEVLMEFGEFLAELRKEKGFLQKEVAAYLNMTVATVSNYEKGVHSPDLITLSKLADFYNVSTDYLLQRTKYKASIDSLNKELSADYTVGDLMNTTLELDRRNVNALLDYYELLSLRNSFNKVK